MIDPDIGTTAVAERPGRRAAASDWDCCDLLGIVAYRALAPLRPMFRRMTRYGTEDGGDLTAMSAFPPKADKWRTSRDVCFVPKADIRIAANNIPHSITSSAVASSLSGIVRPSSLAVLRLIAIV